MRGKTALLSLVLCVFLSALPGRLPSQIRKPQSRAEFERRAEELRLKIKRDQEEFRRRAEQQRSMNAKRRRIANEYSDEAYREALGATPEQWLALRPLLERIRSLGDVPRIEISVYAVGGSGGYQVGSFVETSDGGRSTANASGRFSATRGVNTESDSTTRSGGAGRDAASGYGQTTAGGGAHIEVQTPGPVRKQVGDLNLGWQWQRPSLKKSPDALSESEKVCEQLLDALEPNRPDRDQVRRQVEALRKAREQRQRELRQARRQLRELVTPEQEARLILMGYLD